jgi:hypothetical protein
MTAIKNHFVETRFTADRSKPGSRWERTGPTSDEVTARAEYEILKMRPGVDVRLVRLEWNHSEDDALPFQTVVAEATGAA